MGKTGGKKGFRLNNDYMEQFLLMSDEEAGKLIKALFCYVNGLPYEELTGLPLGVFSFIRIQVQIDSEKHEVRCEINRRNGKMGGRPKKDKTAETEKPKETEKNELVLKPIIEKANDQKPEELKLEEPNRKQKRAEYGTEFEQFWLIYPRKTGKGEAYKKYKARLNDGWAEEQLLEAARAYAEKTQREHTDPVYIKHAKTFLSDSTPFIDFLPGGAEAGMRNSAESQHGKSLDDMFREWKS